MVATRKSNKLHGTSYSQMPAEQQWEAEATAEADDAEESLANETEGSNNDDLDLPPFDLDNNEDDTSWDSTVVSVEKKNKLNCEWINTLLERMTKILVATNLSAWITVEH